MASMTIRNLDDALKTKLRLQAAINNRSMEEEARTILKIALSKPTPEAPNLAQSIRSRLETVGGVELDIAPRAPIRNVTDFT
jgi:antitoxin FitA